MSIKMSETRDLLVNAYDNLMSDARRTMTTGPVCGAFYDPDDGLPLFFEGELTYGDGRLNYA